MSTKNCIAMILAGGRGERLGALTHYYSKPAVYFGGNHRIIDFTLSNCRRSGINTVGILSQYFSSDLHTYIDTIHHGDPKIYMLPSQNNEDLYTGTADAVSKNTGFIDRFDPENVLVLAGDHIYRMDYGKMIASHKETGADVTVAATLVPRKDASRFGILNTDETGCVRGFEEKPSIPKSRLASMGIYVFKWSALKKYLLADRMNIRSKHDFGRDILPWMLRDNMLLHAYTFEGYWRDVGTVGSLWEANMDQIESAETGPWCDKWGVLNSDSGDKRYSVSNGAEVSQSIVSGRCSILGKVRHSVLGDSVTVGEGAEVVNSVIMPNAYIGNNVKICNAVVGTRAVIMDNTVIGAKDGMTFFIDRKVCSNGVSLVAPWLYIEEGMRFQSNSHIYKERLDEWAVCVDMVAEPAYCLMESRYPSRRRQYASLAYR